jgi:hypothetical protein
LVHGREQARETSRRPRYPRDGDVRLGEEDCQKFRNVRWRGRVCADASVSDIVSCSSRFVHSSLCFFIFYLSAADGDCWESGTTGRRGRAEPELLPPPHAIPSACSPSDDPRQTSSAASALTIRCTPPQAANPPQISPRCQGHLLLHRRLSEQRPPPAEVSPSEQLQSAHVRIPVSHAGGGLVSGER